MWFSGISQGLMWREETGDGDLVHTDWSAVINSQRLMYVARSLGGGLHIVGWLRMAWNLVATAMKGKAVTVEAEVDVTNLPVPALPGEPRTLGILFSEPVIVSAIDMLAATLFAMPDIALAVLGLALLVGVVAFSAGMLFHSTHQGKHTWHEHIESRPLAFSVLTLVAVLVGSDACRGEPRGPAGATGADACDDCYRCVSVCPTSIDIRNVPRLECVGCANCIDARDGVMAKLGRDPGLVRYDSQRGFAGAGRRFWRGRVFLYTTLFAVGVGVLSLALTRWRPFEAMLLGGSGPRVRGRGRARAQHPRPAVDQQAPRPARVRRRGDRFGRQDHRDHGTARARLAGGAEGPGARLGAAVAVQGRIEGRTDGDVQRAGRRPRAPGHRAAAGAVAALT